MNALILGVTVLVVSACGISAPDAAAVAGTYSGPFTDSGLGFGSLTMTLAQPGGAFVTGGWSAEFVPLVFSVLPQPHIKDGGTLSGTVEGSHVIATLASNMATGCSYRLDAMATTVAASPPSMPAELQLKGTYTTSGGNAGFGARGGTLDLSGH